MHKLVEPKCRKIVTKLLEKTMVESKAFSPLLRSLHLQYKLQQIMDQSITFCSFAVEQLCNTTVAYINISLFVPKRLLHSK